MTPEALKQEYKGIIWLLCTAKSYVEFMSLVIQAHRTWGNKNSRLDTNSDHSNKKCRQFVIIPELIYIHTPD